MRKLILNFIALVFISFISGNNIYAQEVGGFQFQAVARDAEGTTLKNTEIKVVLAIISTRQEILWEETHNLTTSGTGGFSIPFGTIPEAVTQSEVKDLKELNWDAETYSLKVQINDNDLGAQPILPVPIAMYGADEDADPENEIQDITLSNGMLSISKNNTSSPINLSDFVSSEMAWQKDENNALFEGGSIGVGTDIIEGVMDIQGSKIGDDPIFQVKNNKGVPVFAVYNEGVRVYIPDSLSATKGLKGGFAVGGYKAENKSDGNNYLEIKPSGTNINFNTDESDSSSSSEGFSVGGTNGSSNYVYMDGYSVPLTANGGIIIPISIFDVAYPKGNSFLGAMSGQKRKGHFNTSLGYQSGYNLSGGIFFDGISFVSKVASSNTFLGAFAGYETDFGDRNVYIGYQAGYKNTGSGNIIIGYQSGAASTNLNNKLIINNDDNGTPLIFGDFENELLEVNGILNIGTNPGIGDEPIAYVYQGSANSISKQYAFTINDYLWVTRGAEFEGTVISNGSPLSSDLRYKKDIIQINNGLDKILKLSGVYYNWNLADFPNKGFNKNKQIGVIAQDVEKIIPEVVHTNDDGYKSVEYAKLTAVLIEAIKEQQTLIDKQQQEINALKEKNQTELNMLQTMEDMQKTIAALSEKIASMEKYAQE